MHKLSLSSFFILSVTLHFKAGRSGLVVARFLAAREVPGSNRAADKKILSFTKIIAIRSFGHGLHIDGSAYRSTQFPTIRGTVNEYQPYG